MIKVLLSVLIVGSLVSVRAQVTDNFSDGDFTNNPTWAGDNAKFGISGGLLRLQAPALNSTAFLSTPSSAIHDASWEFYAQMDFNTSSSNFMKVFLVSDQADLTSSLNGYYVQVGGTTVDEVALYRQTGTTATKIIDGTDNAINFTTVKLKIKVTRDASGNWSLFSDTSSGGPTGTYTQEGSVSDVVHTVSGHVGVYCAYTSTRSTAFWFDDFLISGTPVPDLTPPVPTTVQVIDPDKLLVSFDESVDVVTAQTSSNYLVSGGIGSPATIIVQSDTSVLAALPTALTNGLSYSIGISGVKDLNGNTMVTASLNFLHFVPQPVTKDDIVISEFVADPTPVVGLPEAEFVELFNRSPNPINLNGWKLTDGSSLAILPNHILLPSSYCVVVASANVTLFPGSLGVASFPSLNNSDDHIVLKDNANITIDSIHYSNTWYHSDEKRDGGWSIEIIDPNNLCGEETNWTASNHVVGGTPGAINSIYDNNVDVTPPKVTSVQIKNANTFEVLFDEKMDGSSVGATSNPRLNFGSIIYSPDLRMLTIHFTTDLQVSTVHTITLANVRDCTGNSLVDNSFQVVLTEAAEAGDLLINEVLFNPKPNGVDFVEIYNNSSKFISLEKWRVANYDGTTITNPKVLEDVVIPPKSYRVVTPESTTLKAEYPNAIEGSWIISSLPPLPDNSGSLALVDSLGNIIDYFQYNESYHLPTITSKEGVSLERISFSGNSNAPSNWRSASTDESQATPGYKNSSAYPFITDFSIVNSRTLSVTFSSPLESASASVKSNYALSLDGGEPFTIEPQDNNKIIVLTFSESFSNGRNFTLTISNIKDPDGKQLSPFVYNFLYFVPSLVNRKDVIVSEFMADPTPPLGLPEAEFVELLNRSSNPVDLLGWKLSDGSTAASLPQYILLPSARCIVTTPFASSSFPGSVAVPALPSLNNAGDNIILKDGAGITIDSIHYANSWYHSDEKKDGGWSIEIIDPENFCGEENNWIASNHPQGGTPGAANSADAHNPDLTPPIIVSTHMKDSNIIEFLFNEKMDGRNVLAMSNPTLNFSASVYSSSLRQLTLTSSYAFQPSTPYEITLTDAMDCSGNLLRDNAFQFVMPEPAEPGDVSINEVLFNPKPNGVDFVEVYNNTSKYLSLKKWSMGNYDGTAITNPKTLGDIILAPKSYIVLTTNLTTLKAGYPKTVEANGVETVLPPLPDDKGSVVLVDSLGNVIDNFFYDEELHSTPNKEGVSLERISSTHVTNDPGNWRSAESYEDFATPGYKNSAAFPFLVALSIENATNLRIDFSGALEETSAIDINNYSLNHNVGAPSTIQLQNGNTTIVLTYSQSFLNGLNYELAISNLKDADGHGLHPITHNFLYFISSPSAYKDVVVTEFMADPSPVVGLPETEYVELFNRSGNPINLLNWKLSDGSTHTTLPHFILMPSSRCVFTPGSTLIPGSIGVSNFPSLNNTGDNIILKDPTGVTIDSITYSESWYHSDEKKDGGWSLEIVDPENICEEEGNWTASESENGGTPGVINSVNATNLDLTAPSIEGIQVTSGSMLEILFNEKMDDDLIPMITINPAISIASVHYENSLKKILLTSNTQLMESNPYTITLSNVFDCSGNELSATTYPFVLPTSAEEGDILINEVLFNPKPGGVDFVEVYNRTNKFISANKLSLANYDNGEIAGARSITMTNAVIPPNSFQVFTTDVEILKSHYPRTIESVVSSTSLPTLADDQGSVAIADDSGKVIDHFVYSDDFHTPFLKDDEGVSLERISLTDGTNNPDNWRSASESENFATPGYKNSTSNEGVGMIEGEVDVSPEIFSPEAPPDDFTRINYKFDQSGKVANAAIYDHYGRVVKTLANNEVLGIEGFFRWDGDREDGGRARAGYYVAMLEVFDSDGSVSTFRMRVVIAYR